MSPELAMQRAYELAQLGFGVVNSNPPVGCVILDAEFNFLSEGYHKKFGGPHAEIEALNNIEDKSKLNGAHFYVTLEACSFEGKTGSCAKALADLPIASVTFGCLDPNPKVSGKGKEILESAGKAVVTLEDADRKFYNLIDQFRHIILGKTCFVALKVATSLDGQISMKNGESQWISNKKSREYNQFLRSKYDAVLVGRKTIEIDDPQLNIRDKKYQRDNKVIILDPSAKLLPNIQKYKVFKIREPKDVIVVTSEDVDISESPCHVLNVKSKNSSLDLKDLRRKLYKESIFSIFCEGGAGTHSQFLKQQEFNKLYQFIAPKLIGSGGGTSWTESLSLESLSEAIEFDSSPVMNLDGDLLFTGYLKI